MNKRIALLIALCLGVATLRADDAATRALYDAIDAENVPGIQKSLQQGASMRPTIKGWPPPFEYAVSRMIGKDKKRGEILLLEMVDALPANDSNDFVLAAGQGYANVVIKMLPTIKDINAKDNFGNTALIAAAGGKDEAVPVVEYLVNHKADIHATDNLGKTALANALTATRNRETSSSAIANILLDHGAQVTIDDLSIAVRNSGDFSLIKRMVAKVGSINAKDRGGNNLLNASIEGGKSKDVVTYLLAHGADVNAVDPNDADSILINALRTYYYQSHTAIDLEVLEALLKHGARIDERTVAFARGDFKQVATLTDQKKFPDYADMPELPAPDKAKKDAVLALFKKYKK